MIILKKKKDSVYNRPKRKVNSYFGVLGNLIVNISTYLAKQQGRQRRLLSSDLRVTSSQGVMLSSAVVRCRPLGRQRTTADDSLFYK